LAGAPAIPTSETTEANKQREDITWTLDYKDV